MINDLFIILAGILWGSMGLFVRGLASYELTSTEIVTVRTLGSLLFLLFIVFIKDRSMFKVKLKDFWCFIGTGIISLTFFNFCYFTTIQNTSMAVAAILLYTSPIFVVLFSAILFKEKITLLKVVAMIFAVVGCAFVTAGDGSVQSFAAGSLISAGGSSLGLKGILIGIGAGVGYALYSIFGRYAINKGYSSLTITFYTMLLGTIGANIMAPFPGIISKIKTVLYVRDSVSPNSMPGYPILFLYIVGLVIVATILPYLLYTKGLKKVENGKAGIMAAIEPIVAAVLGIVIFHEALTLLTIIGIVLVLGAIVLLNLKSDVKKTTETE